MDDSTGLGLNEREMAILSAIVRMHIDSKEPVGSKALATRLEQRLSPATVRSVMASLSERGLIEKPHTSAGRIPTDLGVRFYVDSMLEFTPADHEQESEIMARVGEATTVDSAAVEAGRTLSRLAQHACVLRAPRAERSRLAHVDLVRIRDDALMCILVSEEGRVQNRLVEVGEHLRARLKDRRLVDEELAAMSQTLCELARGRTMAELRMVLAERVASEHREALALLEALVGPTLTEPAEEALPLVVAGGSHLVQSADPDSLDRLREVYGVLEEQRRLLEVLDLAEDAPGVRIFIGHESGLGELADMALVTATYGRGRDILGSIGVLGPRHMDYARVVPLVTVTAEAVSGLFDS